jgi:hypothetical protein
MLSDVLLTITCLDVIDSPASNSDGDAVVTDSEVRLALRWITTRSALENCPRSI